jgi:hypothetical protein
LGDARRGHRTRKAAVAHQTQQKRQTQVPKQKLSLCRHKALAKVFRAKMLEAIRQEGLDLPASYPEKGRW